MTGAAVVVLRPERAAARTAERLVALGYRPIVAPVLAIDDLPSPIPALLYDAVLATSANGLRKLKTRPEIAALSRLPLIAVGDRTAEAGREAGFATVHVAEGDGRALVAEARALFPEPARFLHAAGADRAFDVAAALARHGHAVTVVELYAAMAADVLPQAAADALASGQANAVLHHSKRIAETFLTLCDAAGLGRQAKALAHVALAPRIAGALRSGGCAWVSTSARPDEEALFDALKAMIDGASPSGVERPK